MLKCSFFQKVHSCVAFLQLVLLKCKGRRAWCVSKAAWAALRRQFRGGKSSSGSIVTALCNREGGAAS